MSDEPRTTRLAISKEPEAQHDAPMPVAFGLGALKDKSRASQSYMRGVTTAIDFHDGRPPMVICQGEATVSRLVLDGVELKVHERDIDHFDERGRPVYLRRDRRASATFKVTLDPPMRRWLLRRRIERRAESVLRWLARLKLGSPVREKDEGEK